MAEDYAADLSAFDGMDSSDYIDNEAISVTPYIDGPADGEFPAFAQSALDPIREEWLKESDGTYVKPLFRRIVPGTGFPYTASTFPRSIGELTPSNASDMRPRYADYIRTCDYWTRLVAVTKYLAGTPDPPDAVTASSFAGAIAALNSGQSGSGGPSYDAVDSDVGADEYASQYRPPFLFLNRVAAALNRAAWSGEYESDSEPHDRYVTEGSPFEIAHPVAGCATVWPGFGFDDNVVNVCPFSVFVGPANGGSGYYYPNHYHGTTLGPAGPYYPNSRLWPGQVMTSSPNAFHVRDVWRSLGRRQQGAATLQHPSQAVSGAVTHGNELSAFVCSVTRPVGTYGTSVPLCRCNLSCEPWRTPGSNRLYVVSSPYVWPESDSDLVGPVPAALYGRYYGDSDSSELEEDSYAMVFVCQSPSVGINVATPEFADGMYTYPIPDLGGTSRTLFPFDPDRDTENYVSPAFLYNRIASENYSTGGFVSFRGDTKFASEISSLRARWEAHRRWSRPSDKFVSAVWSRLYVPGQCTLLATTALRVDTSDPFCPRLVRDDSAVDLARRVRFGRPVIDPFVALAHQSDVLRPTTVSLFGCYWETSDSCSLSDSLYGDEVIRVSRIVATRRYAFSDQTHSLELTSEDSESQVVVFYDPRHKLRRSPRHSFSFDFGSGSIYRPYGGSTVDYVRSWRTSKDDVGSPDAPALHYGFGYDGADIVYSYLGIDGGIFSPRPALLVPHLRRLYPIAVSGGGGTVTEEEYGYVNVAADPGHSVPNYKYVMTRKEVTTYGDWNLEGSLPDVALVASGLAQPPGWAADRLAGETLRCDLHFAGVKAHGAETFCRYESRTDGTLGGESAVSGATRSGSVTSREYSAGMVEQADGIALGVPIGEYPRSGRVRVTFPLSRYSDTAVVFGGSTVTPPDEEGGGVPDSLVIDSVEVSESESGPPDGVLSAREISVKANELTVTWFTGVSNVRCGLHPMRILGLE